MLAPAIEGVLRQETNGVRYEFLVVDNNSTDETRTVIEKYINGGATNLRYIFEAQQGLSHARNAGIKQSHAPLIAFTDDDVRVQPDWVYKIKQTFDRYPEVDFIGGKVLPLWEQEPPSWLTKDQWSPLALLDNGDKPLYMNRQRPFCLVGANLAVRREAFERVGMFGLELQRIKDGIGSSEDHEWQVRVWQAGRQGLYVPELVIHAEVQKERLTKAYHRRWHTGHGKSMAVMQWYEITQGKNELVDEVPKSKKLLGVSGWFYRDVLSEMQAWLKAKIKQDDVEAFKYELMLRNHFSYIRKRRKISSTKDAPSTSLS